MFSDTSAQIASFRTGEASQTVTCDIVALIRWLCTFDVWASQIQQRVVSALQPLPSIFQEGFAQSLSSLPASFSSSASSSSAASSSFESSSSLTPPAVVELAMASLSVIGGLMDVPRVGGRVEVSAVSNPNKKKPGLLVAHDRLACTAKVFTFFFLDELACGISSSPVLPF